MQAGTDISLNGNFSGGDIYGAPASRFLKQVSFVCGFVPEPGFNPYAAFMPTHPASVYSAPAVIGTAAVGKSPWDAIYGPIGVGASHGNINVPALVLAPQVGTSSFA
jgi:hypothetical protein